MVGLSKRLLGGPRFRRGCFHGRGASAVFRLGFDGQPLAHLAGPMDADTTLAMHATSGTVTRSWRAAATLRLANGTIMDFYVQQRDGSSADDKRIAGIYVRSSSDECQTWSAMRCIYLRESAGVADYASSSKWINGPLGVAQHSSGRIHLVFVKSDGVPNSQLMTPWHMSSSDNGATWNGAAVCTTPTNISSTVLKTNNSTPAGQPACYGDTNGLWKWYMVTSGLCLQNGANAGRIYMFGDHRYSTDENTPATYTSWSHCFYTDNGDSATPTWVLGGGYDEVVAGNDQSNEVAAVEIGTSGHILIQNRIQGTYFRGQATLTDPTTTWPAMDLASNGVADLEANNVHGALWKSSDGSKIYSAYATTNAVRSRITVYESLDAGATWTVGRPIFYGQCGYCYGLELADGSHRVLFEKTHNYAAEAFGAQYVTQARFNNEWLENESTYPAVFEWAFSEPEDGLPLAYVGSQLLDLGKDGTRIFDQRGLGGVTGTTSASYTFDGYYGLMFSGSGEPLILQEAQASGVGGALEPGLESITYEFTLNQPAGATLRVFLDSCNAAGSGVTIWFTAGGLIKCRVSDGTTAVTTDDGVDNVYDGFNRTYAVVVDRAAGTLRCWETTSGTAVALTAAKSIAAVTGKIIGGQATKIGRYATTNTNPLAANTYLRRVRVTRAALASGWMIQNGVIVVHNDILPEPAVPTGIANFPTISPTLWLGATFDNGYHARADKYGGFDHLHHGTILGRGAAAYRDVGNHRLFSFGNSISRGMYWDSDADVGPHWRHMYLSATSAGNYTSCDNVSGLAAAYAALDIVQELGVFSLFMTFKILTDATLCLFDTANNNNANKGFTLAKAGGGGNNVYWRVVSDGAAFNENVAAIGTMPSNAWCNFMVTGNGSGKYTLYRSTTTGGVVGATTSGNTTNDVKHPGTGLGHASTQVASVFARSDSAASGANIRAKNILVYPAALTSANFSALCTLSASY